MLVSSLMQNAWDLSTRPANLTMVAEQQRAQDEPNDDTSDNHIAGEDADKVRGTTCDLGPKQREDHNHLHNHHHDHHRPLVHQQARADNPATVLREPTEEQVATRAKTTSQLSRGVASPASSSSLHQQQRPNRLIARASSYIQRGDRRARKKDQNRRAALNYRRKKMEERNRVREEEMRLVYARVCLIGHAEELESNIKYLLETQCQKLIDKRGRIEGLLCPLCSQTCDNVILMRRHLATWHQQWLINNLQQQQFDNNTNSSSNSINDANNFHDINVNPDHQQEHHQHPSLTEHDQFLHHQQLNNDLTIRQN